MNQWFEFYHMEEQWPWKQLISCEICKFLNYRSQTFIVDEFLQMAGPCDQRPPALSGQLSLAEGVAA